MARGGKRKGRPGAGYGNRTDLVAQPVKTGPSEQYGQRAAQERAQQAIPLPQRQMASPSMVQPAAMPAPIDLFAPTQRPNEPVTSGLPVGPGPGPDPMSMIQPAPAYEPSPTRAMLVELYEATRFPEILDLIERL